MEIFLFWVVFAIAIGVGAALRGRNGFGWFAIAMAIGPLFTLIALALTARRSRQEVPMASEASPEQVAPKSVGLGKPFRVHSEASDAKRSDR